MPIAKNTGNAGLRPALIDIAGAIQYLGGIGKSKFYQDVLPELDTVMLGRRRMIIVASLDEYIGRHRQYSAA